MRRTGNLSALNDDVARLTVTAEVSNSIRCLEAPAGSLQGRFIYRFTQQRIHVIVTKAFLRSLARLDLVPSVVGQLTEGGGNGSAGRRLTR